MLKKMMLIASAIAALGAFALPVAANAQTLTDPVTVPLAVGTKLVATGSDFTTKTALGTLSCVTVTLTGTVGVNTTTKSTLDEITGTTAGCLLNGSTAVTITNLKVADMHLTTGGAATTSGLTFASDIGGLTCDFAGSPGASYTTNTDTIHLSGQVVAPGCGEATITASFTLETHNGTQIIID